MAAKRRIAQGTRWMQAFMAAPLAAGLLLSGCNTANKAQSSGDITGSLQDGSERDKALHQASAHWANRFAANPKDKTAAVNLSRVLRAQGKKSQAVILMRQAIVHHPRDTDMQAELGKALADAGQNAEAQATLEKLMASQRADWQLVSSYGTVLDQMEKHGQAREQYQKALALAPNEPSVLSNMGLSYALDGNLPEAEKTLRLAAAQPRAETTVLENLALVLGLQGKFEEAEKVARAALPDNQVSGNLSYLKQMLSQPQNWAKLQALEAKNKAAKHQ
ncbi:MAG: tetratricopeptide repeat protein [Rhodobiaceae bacterium]|nr:tetratricopeptide repeat protein [Rhodobiaceae bacterium]